MLLLQAIFADNVEDGTDRAGGVPVLVKVGGATDMVLGVSREPLGRARARHAQSRADRYQVP